MSAYVLCAVDVFRGKFHQQVSFRRENTQSRAFVIVGPLWRQLYLNILFHRKYDSNILRAIAIPFVFIS